MSKISLKKILKKPLNEIGYNDDDWNKLQKLQKCGEPNYHSILFSKATANSLKANEFLHDLEREIIEKIVSLFHTKSEVGYVEIMNVTKHYPLDTVVRLSNVIAKTLGFVHNSGKYGYIKTPEHLDPNLEEEIMPPAKDWAEKFGKPLDRGEARDFMDKVSIEIENKLLPLFANNSIVLFRDIVVATKGLPLDTTMYSSQRLAKKYGFKINADKSGYIKDNSAIAEQGNKNMTKTQFINLIKECMQERQLNESDPSYQLKKKMEQISNQISYFEDKDDYYRAGQLKKEYAKLNAQLVNLSKGPDDNLVKTEGRDDLEFLGGGDETDAEEMGTKTNVLKEIDKVVKEYKGGLKLDVKELNYAAQEEETDVSKLFLADVLYERLSNVFYNRNASKESTYIQVNKPAVKDAIILKIGDNPMASTLVPDAGKLVPPISSDKGVGVLSGGMNKFVSPYNGPQKESMLREIVGKKLKSLIKESIEEIKVEKAKGNITIVEDIFEDIVKKENKDAIMVANDAGNFTIHNCGSHYFDIRPMWKENFDVVYFKDRADRERKFNLNPKALKEYVKSKFDDESNYVIKAYNKNAPNQKDDNKKVEGQPVSANITIKKVSDTKNENKDYNEKQVKKDEDLPDKPLAEVKKFDKLSDHSVKGDKVKFTPPNQDKKEKAHLIKLKNKKLKT